MPNDPKTIEIRDEEYVQEADVILSDVDLIEAQKAFAVIAKLRKVALDHLGVNEENADVTAVDFRIEDGAVVVHVLQAQVD